MEIEECVITKIRERRDAGRKKYGITMERDDLSILEWITHAQEEALDFSIYLEKLKQLHMKTDDQINQELTLSTSDQHKELVHRLKKEPNDIIRNNYTVDVQHMLIGLFGEVGELSDCVKKHTVYGQDLDYKNLLEELGDIEFYLQGLREIFQIDREEVLRQNIEKLNKRYSSGKYSDQEARDRADKKDNELGFYVGQKCFIVGSELYPEGNGCIIKEIFDKDSNGTILIDVFPDGRNGNFTTLNSKYLSPITEKPHDS